MIISDDSIVFDDDKNEYRVLEFIGSGAMGYVFKLEKKEDSTIWALKTLPQSFQDKDTFKAFKNEASLAIKINHKNVIRYLYVHDGDLHKELPPYIIMEYANQGTLNDIIKNQNEKDQFISNDILNKYFKELIEGMETINSLLIHRDIKPDNILISNSQIKISDFGLSKMVDEKTRTSTFKGFGHIKYMSPEAWKLEKNTIQIDIYSMGIVFYELSTLTHPLKVKNDGDIDEWRQAHLFKNPTNPKSINNNLSNVQAQVIMKMMEKSSLNRFKTWNEVKANLKRDDLHVTERSSLIEDLLKIRIEKDSKAKEAQLAKEKIHKEIKEYKNIIRFQFEKDIINPLKNLINEFNLKYINNHIQFESHPNTKNCEISLPSRETIYINIRPLLDADFYKEKIQDDFGRKIKVRTIDRPLFREKIIMAWGNIKNSRGKGFNMILVENENDVYGKWHILINTNDAFNTNKRLPEPFPFEFEELEEEIQFIDASHIYNTKIEQFDIKHFYNIIKDSI